MSKELRYSVLETMHKVYALNEFVETEDGTELRFESAAYHRGMARLYKRRN